MARRRKVLIVAVAVVFVAGGGSWLGVELATPSTPAPTASEVGMNLAWSTEFGGGVVSTGAWMDGSQIVAGYDNAAIAYDLGTGRVEWTWRPPAGDSIGQLSEDTENGTGVLTYAASVSSPASWTMAAIDLADGQRLWARTYTTPSDTGNPLLIGGGRIAALSSGDLDQGPTNEALTVSALGTGAVEWTASSDSAATNDCALRSDAFVGTLIYVEGYCGGSDTKMGTDDVFALVAQNGALQARIPVRSCGDDLPDPVVWSVPGRVVADCKQDVGGTAANLWDALAGAHSLAVVGDPTFAPSLGAYAGVTGMGSYPAFAVFNGTLYVTGSGSSRSTEGTVEAVDLTNGRELWERPLPAGYDGWIVGASARGVDVALDSGRFLSLVRYSPTGAESAGPGIKSPGAMPGLDYDRFALDGDALVVLGLKPIPTDSQFEIGTPTASAITVLHLGSWPS